MVDWTDEGTGPSSSLVFLQNLVCLTSSHSVPVPPKHTLCIVSVVAGNLHMAAMRHRKRAFMDIFIEDRRQFLRFFFTCVRKEGRKRGGG